MATQQVVLILNALSATIPLYSPEINSLMARTWLTLDHATITLLFLSIAAYTQIGTERQKTLIQWGATLWFGYLFYENHFNYPLDPLLMSGISFNSLTGYPVAIFTDLQSNLFKTIITSVGLCGMTLSLPMMTWRTQIPRNVHYAALLLSVFYFFGLINLFRPIPFHTILSVIGYSMLAYTILNHTLFAPLHQADLDLAASKRELEKANVWIEHLVFERTKELESTVAREHMLAQELEHALAEAVRLNKMKSKIIETVSHEFRTPLTKISTSTELLTKYRDRLTPEKQHRLQQNIERSIHYITRLIENVLLIDTGAQSHTIVEHQMISMATLCHSLEIRMQNTFDDVTFTVTYQTEDIRPVYIDSNLLGQVLQQLLDNARKFSAEPNSICVQLSLLNETLQMTVTDTGIGIPDDDLEHIWELFYRGNNIGTRRGLGVGLYATRRIVEDMGGTISAESNTANTTFTVTLNITNTNTSHHPASNAQMLV